MTTVLVHGVFDLLHKGHIFHLMQAKALGTKLIVSVVPDEWCTKRPPVHPEEDRITMLAALKCVDVALLCGGPGPEKLLRLLMPDLYIRGNEYAAQDKPEYALCQQLGINFGFIHSIPPHTSDIIAKIKAL